LTKKNKKSKKNKADNSKKSKSSTRKTLINIWGSLALLLISVILFFIGAEVFARIYQQYSDFPIEPRAEERDDNVYRIIGTKIEKEPGVKRLLVLGDSIAFGQAIMKEETFSKRLEKMLNKGKPKEQYEVINTGFMGIDTVQELMILLNQGPFGSSRPELVKDGYVGLAYNPDIILLEYTVLNDSVWIDKDTPFEIAMPHRWPSDRSRKWSYGDYAIPVPKSLDNWLGKNSLFYHYFLHKYNGFLKRLGLRNYAWKIRDMYKPDSKGWLRSKSALAQIGRIAHDKKIPAVLVLWSKNNNDELEDIYELIAEEGKKNGFYVLNMNKDIKWPEENFSVSMTDGHPNGKANKIAAQAIYKFLREKNLVLKQ